MHKKLDVLKQIFTLKLLCFTRKCCEVKVSISSFEESKNNQSTFNWGPGKKYDFCHICYYSAP